ncbi:MAG TPA: YitT family protein [Bacillota bacterium]|nr:YitT family protein [Bacillota bacterium]HPF42034.1 YitT family protein [Bacillota bacterium]HPJ85892.1 YitT family protein [Bacillota bacterium]HPQ61786.1 YitT family protein [Bacillota bacterium]HRX91237.1 YitT family protein [Candidatus Izemoplasmatales bacterium]
MKENFLKNFDGKKEARTMFNTVVGTAIYALGILFFIDPAKLYSGGVTGLSQLIVNVVELLSSNNIHINLGILSFILQVPLLVFAYFKLNGRFVFYTIVSVVVFTLILLFRVNEPLMGSDMLTNALVGGILGGIGNGMLHRVGASSGGTSIPFQYWSIKSGKSMGTYQIFLHGLIILLSGVIFGLNIAIYTMISQLISSIVLDKIFTGYNFMKLEVVTTNGKEMAEALKTRLPHGVTMIDAVGAYTYQAKTVIYAVISVHEIHKYVSLIRQIDPQAFVVMTGVSSVMGKFTKKIIN